MAKGWMVDGFVPALKTSKRSSPRCFNNPSAIWLRHELPVQTKSTRFISFLQLIYRQDVSSNRAKELEQAMAWVHSKWNL
tara:strand:- start:264 stop:503 length:240 start_codon:yes stop_codon:yes gene_type:complete